MSSYYCRNIIITFTENDDGGVLNIMMFRHADTTVGGSSQYGGRRFPDGH